MKAMGFERIHVAEICGVKPNAVTKWRQNADKDNHRTMPVEQWMKLMSVERCFSCTHYQFANDSCDENVFIAGDGCISYVCDKYKCHNLP